MSQSFLNEYTSLDLTDFKGQLCGRILGDLGMEILKVEPPGGDPVRRFPPFIDFQNGSRLSLAFAHLNANKKSVVLDLQDKGDRSDFVGLAEKSDLLIESFAPGFLSSLGLGYADLTKINPRLVMVSISAFGQSGPHAQFAVSDIVAFAMSGLMHIAGDPALPPCNAPETQAYYFGSLFAALGALAALFRRERTGKGDWIDASMQETLATQEHLIRLYANENVISKRQGSQHGQVAPAKIFRCKDGYVYLYVTRQHWKLFLKVWQDHPAKFDAPEWLNNLYRRSRADEINQEIERFVSGYGKEELTAHLQSNGIPCVPVNRPREFINDEQIRQRGFFVPVAYAGLGDVAQPAAPFLVDGSRLPVSPAPALGAQQDEVGKKIRRAGSPLRASARAPGAVGEGEQPLNGMRIVSFDHVLAGPYGMTLLAELGAEVIKVESSRGGLDPFRFFGKGDDPNLSPRFFEFNRNKLSVTINLKHPEGPKMVKELARRSDAVVDNFSVRVMPSLGLDYEGLRQVKEDIIDLRMPGLGCTGPKNRFATVGTNITAFTGITYLWNHSGKIDPPTGSQCVLPDYVSGVLGATVIVASVLFRQRTGKGAFIDMSQGEAAAYMIGISLTEALNAGCDPEPAGNSSRLAVPHGCYPCKGEDRWCVIAVETEKQWRSLAEAIGRPELARDPRCADVSGRKANESEINEMLGAWTRDKDGHEVMARLQRVGVPCGVVQNGADLVADNHLKARGFIVEQENARVGRVVLPGFPIRFANARLEPNWEFPELGRDNERVFGKLLGYSPERVAELRREGLFE